jgi:D-alanine-D-alanine ligase
MKIAITCNIKVKDNTKPADFFSEFDSRETIEAIAAALRKIGHSVDVVEAADHPDKILAHLTKNRPEMVFNIAEGKSGKFRESEIPAILDFLRIPYTGSNTFVLALALNKALTKKILLAENIPTPRFQLFVKGDEEVDSGLKFPLIVKPNCEGSAKGIHLSNVVKDRESLLKKAREVIRLYNHEALAEEFIEGREFTVGILENGKALVLPILEIDFSTCSRSGEFFYSWRMKEYQGDEAQGLVPTFRCPAPLDKETETKIKEVALKTHRAVGCLDISRTDIRLDANNVPYVLEINPLPGLSPKESNFPLMAYAAGMRYDDIIEAILLSASERRMGSIGE